MTQSLSLNYIHAIFSVKNKNPLIKPEIKKSLFAYISGILKNMQSYALEINCMPDHLHVLFNLSKNYSLANVLENMKKDSSKWMKVHPSGDKKFYWQGGYAAFSIGRTELEMIHYYIRNQKTHHQKMKLKEEIEQFVKEYNVIEYNPDYFWS